MKKTIFLHVGQTKTATTTLQAFFSDNRAWLANQGIDYPECPPDHPIKSQHRFLVEPLAGLQRPFPDEIPGWTYIKQKIKASSLSSILISEEVFWHLFERRREEKVEILRWIKNQLSGHDVKIVCYLRRQDKWIESWFNQLTKTDVNHYSRMNYHQFIQAYKDQGMLNYVQALQPWITVFGEDNLIVRPFEKSQFLKGDVIQDFLSIIGVRLLDSGEIVRPADQQVSLCNSACEISNIYNSTVRAKEFKQRFMEIVHAYDEQITDHRRFTPHSIATSLLDEYRSSNQEIAARFGGRLPEFFEPELNDYDAGEFTGTSTQELVRFMIQIFQDQQGQIRQLRKRLSDVERNPR
jgi:hypothetical protein